MTPEEKRAYWAARARKYRALYPEKERENQRRAREKRKLRDPQKVREDKRAYYLANREQVLAEKKRQYREDPVFAEKNKANARAWRLANPERSYRSGKRANLRQYGMTIEQHDAMFEAQGGVCAICPEPLLPGRGTHVDHDHETGKVRALLCLKCNAAVGYVRDSPVIAVAIADYLRKHGRE